MSSIRVDASGARSLTSTINDPQRTIAQIPTKPDDELSLTVSGANGTLEVVVPPSLVTVERIKGGNGSAFDVYYLKFRGGISNARFGREDPAGSIFWPHAEISARKDVARQYGDSPAETLGTLDDLVGAAEDVEGARELAAIKQTIRDLAWHLDQGATIPNGVGGGTAAHAKWEKLRAFADGKFDAATDAFREYGPAAMTLSEFVDEGAHVGADGETHRGVQDACAICNET